MVASDPKVLQAVYTPTDVANYTMDVIDSRIETRRHALRSGAGMLDNYMKPVLPGEVINVLAYTSHGKTAFMQSWARNVVRQLRSREKLDEIVVYLTWETLVEELGLYDLAAMTGVDSSDAWYGDLRDEQVNELRIAAMKRCAMPLWVMGYSLKRRKESGSFTMTVVSDGLRAVEESYGLRPAIIFVDYLQVIDPLNRAQDRRIQVLRNVDMLKQLARQCGCPVVNGVQAGRDVLTREFKLPEIGDGQECLAGDALLMDAQTGIIRSAKQWYDLGCAPQLHSMVDWKLCPNPSDELTEAGIADIYKITTMAGHELRVSGNHPFFSDRGWVHAEDLCGGDWVAVARKLRCMATNDLTERRAELLGVLIGDGSYTNGSTPTVCTGRDKGLAEYLGHVCEQEFQTRTVIQAHSKNGCWNVFFSGPINEGPKLNPLILWLKTIGVYGQKHDDATVPEIVMAADDRAVAAFLRGLVTTDGSFPRNIHRISDSRIYISSVSQDLVRQVRFLLLRLGFPSVIRQSRPGKRNVQTCYQLTISGMNQVRRFMSLVGFIDCDKGRRAQETLSILQSQWQERQIDADRFPSSINEQLIDAVKAFGRRTKHGQRVHLNMVHGRGVSRSRLLHAANLIGDEEMFRLASGDVSWTKIRDVVPDGREMTYDLSVPGTHNFVVDGMITHNTSRSEQDADKVIALWYPCKTEVDGTVIQALDIRVDDRLMVFGIRKQRHAASGQVFPLHFDPETNTFTDWIEPVAAENHTEHQTADTEEIPF
jgi:replicative DNA helicase